jgi:MerR family transcriptional regulator, light-induced transcriptional regulator
LNKCFTLLLFNNYLITMNSIKSTFTIQDLEILTGIKAHTLRIWEKRYDLLNPMRLNRDIRVYSLEDLQKILNISLLYKQNYKISKIAKYSDKQLVEEAKELALKDVSNNYEINSLIISMYTFDEELFHEVHDEQSGNRSFDEIFEYTYLPLLDHIGVLWQTESIKPAHEHFISNLIYQKILKEITLITKSPAKNSHVNILFLPEGEVHEIGLLYLYYVLKMRGERIVYLGRSIPFDNLFYLNSQFKKISWVCTFLIGKTQQDKDKFISQMEELLLHTKNNCMVFGKIWKADSETNTHRQIRYFEGFRDFIPSEE